MYRVIDKRDTGKTRKLLEECAYNHGVFVCKHPHKVKDKCLAYGINYSDIVEVLGYDAYLMRASFKEPHPEIYVDELELFVKHCMEGKLGGYTLTNED